MPKFAEALAEHPFTRGLAPSHVARLRECAIFERFGAQEAVFREGDSADRFYLIRSGVIALQTFAPGLGVTTILNVGTRDVLGWSWLVPPYRWHFTAVTLEPVEAVGLYAATLRDRMLEDHDFGYAIYARMTPVLIERLQSARVRLLEPYGTAA